NQLNPDERQRTNRRHHHERAVAVHNPINTKRTGAHRDRRAAAPVNHTANLPDPPGIAAAGLPSPPGGNLPHVLPRAGLIDINGHDSPHSPTQRTTLICDHIVALAYWA